jgi:hypothetical protein
LKAVLTVDRQMAERLENNQIPDILPNVKLGSPISPQYSRSRTKYSQITAIKISCTATTRLSQNAVVLFASMCGCVNQTSHPCGFSEPCNLLQIQESYRNKWLSHSLLTRKSRLKLQLQSGQPSGGKHGSRHSSR